MALPPAWTVQRDVLPGEGEVVLVLAELDVAPARLDALRAHFSPRDEARWSKFSLPVHRARWGASRGILREVLGAAAGLSPREVQLVPGTHGKPRLDGGQQPRGAPLAFNLSHSERRALIALARGREVGVDIEFPLDRRRTDDIARRFYAPGEQERLFALTDPDARMDAFFRLWTCKEAFMKVTGEGLSRSPRSFEVELDGGRASLLWADGLPDAAERFSVHPLDVGPGYRACLLTERLDVERAAQSAPALRLRGWD